MNPDSLIYSAKMRALQLAQSGYTPPRLRKDIRVMGIGGIAEFKVRINMFLQGKYISDHDALIANKLAFVLCGGDIPDNSLVTEDYLLNLEKEAFLSLVATDATQARIAHILKTGKPLRN